jgi:hypothetical protein
VALYNVDAAGRARHTAIHEDTGNDYQPVGFEIGTSYIDGCSFHHNYGVALGGYKTENIALTNNVIYSAVDDGIRMGTSYNMVIDGNMITKVMENWFYMNHYTNFHNFNIDGLVMPAGIHAQDDVTFVSMKDNAVSSIMGPAYEIAGEYCNTEEADSAESAESMSSNNYGHSSLYGLRVLFASVSDYCTRFSGFKLARTPSNAVVVMIRAEHTVIQNIDVQDAPHGVFMTSYYPLAVTHMTQDKTLTIKNSIFNAVTNAFSSPTLDNCRDWAWFEGESDGFGGMFGGDLFDFKKIAMDPFTFDDDGYGSKGITWPIIQGQMPKFPHVALDEPTSNMVLYGQTLVNGVTFVNYIENDGCGKTTLPLATIVACLTIITRCALKILTG